MNVSKREKEISFQRPHYAVDLVEKSLDSESASVVCMARSESKLFIAFKIFQQFRRRALKPGSRLCSNGARSPEATNI